MIDSDHQHELGGPHLTEAEVAAFLDGRLAPEPRARVESHLADCETCRTEVVEVKRLLAKEAQRQRWRVALPVAAAVTAILLVGPLARRLSVPEGPVLRGLGDTAQVREGTQTFEAIRPTAAQPTPVDSVAFVWRRAAPSALYRLTVTDVNGDPVWTTSTSDTLATLPPDVGLGRDRFYYWYVDALLADGRSATTGVRRFRTAR